MFDLSGKVAIITGSSRGIGAATAHQLASAGAKVVVSSRKIEACQEIADEIIAKGHEAIAVACHVGDKAQVDALVEKVVGHWGQVDILISNAATNPYYGPFSGLSDDAFLKVMNVNVQASIWLCNAVVPHMEKQGGGAIVLMSSIMALIGNRNIGVYGMSKAAEASLARNMAVEHGGKNIRVNAIAPGVIKTKFAQALWDDPKYQAHQEKYVPLGRFGEVDEIAGIAHFLSSQAASFVTGQVIVADGGETIASA